MNEAQWKARLRREFDTCGVSLSLHGHMMQAPGWPDLYVATTIWDGWIELKAFEGELSMAQRMVGRKLTVAAKNFVVLRASKDWLSMRLESWNGETWSPWLLPKTPMTLVRHICEFCNEDPL